MACDHFPLIDTLDLPTPAKLNYCRLTHPSHRLHLAYRRGLERVAAGLEFAEEPAEVPAQIPASSPAPVAPDDPPSTGPRPVVVPPDAPYPPPGSSPEQVAARSHAKVHGKRVSANPHLARLDVIRECDYRGEQLQGVGGGCGCTATWHCAMKKGPIQSSPFEVGLSDCLRCVSGQA